MVLVKLHLCRIYSDNPHMHASLKCAEYKGKVVRTIKTNKINLDILRQVERLLVFVGCADLDAA